VAVLVEEEEEIKKTFTLFKLYNTAVLQCRTAF